MEYEELDKNNILQRTEVVNKFAGLKHQDHIIITYPEAIFEQVISPLALEKNKLELIRNESVDLETLIEVLDEFGFEGVDFVYEPGQFSIRGGIVDIFSFGNEWPYRIELFDDEIESIRTFDPMDQLSKQNIARIRLIPHVQEKFNSAEKKSLLNVLPENTKIWMTDLSMCLEKLQLSFESLEKYAASISNTDDDHLKKILNERAFVYPGDIISGIAKHDVIFYEKEPVDQSIITTTIDFNAEVQPNFNRNFNLLIEDLKKHQSNGYTSFIFTENPKQFERFHHIFEDLGADIQFHPVNVSIHSGFIDHSLKIVCYTDHQIFNRFHRYNLKKGFTKDQALNLKMIRELQSGDFVTHIDHGIGRYSGLERLEVGGRVQESIRLIYKNNDVLYVGINSLHKISKYIGKEGTPPQLSKLGGDTWKNLKRKTKRKVKDIAHALITLYAKRKAAIGHAFPPDDYLQNELEASFIYEDTPDQYQATKDVKSDMELNHPMDRLICGDVGFGKTEIAVRAAFKCVSDGKQVAILVPTTILALQHYQTFLDRLKDFPVTVDYVNRFKSVGQRNAVFEELKTGKLDIIIGTHALLNKKVAIKDLGLLIIDEEQKFGVSAKEKLRNLKVNVDTLTLTATPIPRTLQFSLMAARDLSIIRTAPPNRQPIHTERRLFSDSLIKEAIYYEVHRGGQIFFVHNRVRSLPDMAALIQRICPDIHIRMAHGQMESKILETTLIDFIENKFDVLVCTNIIETGLDIPNANTIMINNAQHFGMSDLHQLRGRVGRSNQRAFCYLFTPPISVLSTDARKRLKTLEEFSQLGSGFHIAMRDLDIRGAGNLLGAEQSGFISDIGFDAYKKILEEAVIELKETEFKELFKAVNDDTQDFTRDVIVDTDHEILIPDTYVSNVQERLKLYTELDGIDKEEDIIQYRARLFDRFGPVPTSTDDLLVALRIRWVCKKLGFQKLILKNNKLQGFFIGDPQSPFFESAFFKLFLARFSEIGQEFGLQLRQGKKHLILIKENVHSLTDAHQMLKQLRKKFQK